MTADQLGPPGPIEYVCIAHRIGGADDVVAAADADSMTRLALSSDCVAGDRNLPMAEILAVESAIDAG